MIIALDYNCVIALEEKREPDGIALRELAALCTSNSIPLAVYSWIELENPQIGTKLGDRDNITARLKAVGIERVELRQRETLVFDDQGGGPGDFEVGQNNWFIWRVESQAGRSITGSAYEDEFIRWVHQVLFQNIDFAFQDYVDRYCRERGLDKNQLGEQTTMQVQRKWMNAKSDALSLCAYLSWGEGIFVTSDRNFHKKQDKLRQRAPSIKVMTPVEALAAVRNLLLGPISID